MTAETPNQNNKNPEASSQQLPPDVEETLVPPEPTPAAKVTSEAEAESVAEAVPEPEPEPAPEAPEPIPETPEAPLPEAPGEETPTEEQPPVEAAPEQAGESIPEAVPEPEAAPAEAPAAEVEPAPEGEEPAAETPEVQPSPAEAPAEAPEPAEAPAEVPEARLLPRNVKEEQKAKEQAIDQAIEILKDPKVMERSPREIVDAFREATGEELIPKRERMAEANFKSRGMRIIRGKDAVEVYRKQLIEKEQERIIQEEHSKALDTLWKRNPNVKPENREKYLAEIKMALGIKEAGDNIALDKLINEGYAVENSKRGLFGFGKLKIPTVDGKGILTYANGKDLLGQNEVVARARMLGEAQGRANLKIDGGREILKAERQACTRTIIGQTVERYEEDREAGEKIDYRESELAPLEDKVHNLGGHTHDILRPKLSKIIRRNQLTLKAFGERLPKKEWNRIMELKQAAGELLQTWIDEQPKSKPEKKNKAKNKGEKPVTKPGGKKPSESESKPSKREKSEKKETPKKPAPKKKKK